MASAPDVLLHRFQSVLNAAVQLVFSARRSDHATPLLCELHWLKVPERVRFRLCVLIYRCLNGTAPHYLAETTRPVSIRGTRQHLRSAETSTLLVPSTRRSTPVIGHSQWLPHGLGTATRSERAFTFRLPPRTEDRSVPVVVPWCDLTMYCALSARPLLSADLSPCTGCYRFCWHCTVVMQQQCDNST